MQIYASAGCDAWQNTGSSFSGFNWYPYHIQRALHAVMGALPDLVPLIINFSIGSGSLHSLDPVEACSVDDSRVVVFWPEGFAWNVSYPFYPRILCSNRLPIDEDSHILLIGKDVTDGPDSPSPVSFGTRDAWGFQFLFNPHDAPALLIPAEA